jgi:hypothetical protein
MLPPSICFVNLGSCRVAGSAAGPGGASRGHALAVTRSSGVQLLIPAEPLEDIARPSTRSSRRRNWPGDPQHRAGDGPRPVRAGSSLALVI